VGLSSANSFNLYTASGSDNEYAFTFRVDEAEHLRVVVATDDASPTRTVLVEGVDYEIDGLLEDGGGTITLIDSGQAWLDSDGELIVDYQLLLRLYVPLTQLDDYKNQEDLHLGSLEKSLDQLVMRDQRQQHELDRAVKLNEMIDTADFDPTLPDPVANAPIIFNADGDGLSTAATLSPPSVAVSAYMQTLLDDADAAAARTTLDVTQAIDSMTEETAPAVGDFIPIRDISEPADNKMTLQNMLKVIDGLTEDTNPAAGDELVTYDASAAGPKKVKVSTLAVSDQMILAQRIFS
jgi:hypothetical protein